MPVLKVSVLERVNVPDKVFYFASLFHRQEMTCFCFGNVKEYRCTLDCEQPLFFFTFSKGSARARALSGKAARRENSEMRALSCLSRLVPSVSRVVICVSQAFCSTDKENRETARSLAALEKKTSDTQGMAS